MLFDYMCLDEQIIVVFFCRQHDAVSISMCMSIVFCLLSRQRSLCFPPQCRCQDECPHCRRCRFFIHKRCMTRKKKERKIGDDDDEAKKPSSYFLQKIPTGNNKRRCLYVDLFERKRVTRETCTQERFTHEFYVDKKKKHDSYLSIFVSLVLSIL